MADVLEAMHWDCSQDCRAYPNGYIWSNGKSILYDLYVYVYVSTEHPLTSSIVSSDFPLCYMCVSLSVI